MCTSWMRAVMREGTTSIASQRLPISPPPAPVSPIVSTDLLRASRSPARMLGLLPEVEIPTAASPGLAERFDLTGENISETQVVAACSQRRRVRRERDGCDRGTVRFVPDYKFCGDVLRISGASAVAEQQQFASPADRLLADIQNLRKRATKARGSSTRRHRGARPPPRSGMPRCRGSARTGGGWRNIHDVLGPLTMIKHTEQD